MPEAARKGDRINITGLLMNSGRWEGAELMGMWVPGNTSQMFEVSSMDGKFVETVDAGNAVFIPDRFGTLRLKHYVSSQFSTQLYTGDIRIDADPDYKGSTYAGMIASTPATLDIDRVTVDGSTGKYKIEWTLPEKHRGEAIGINVYRETSYTDR